MWTFKNVFALGLFLFGTTFLWMTASMAGKTSPPSGTAWTLANVLCYLAVIGFALAAWAVFKEYSWWETPALLSGIVGLIAVVPFIVGQSQLDIGFGDLGVQINLWMHVLGSAAVIAIVLVLSRVGGPGSAVHPDRGGPRPRALLDPHEVPKV